MGRQDVTGSWSVAQNTAGGCPKNPDTWTFNPTYALAPSRGGTFKLTIAQNGTRADWHPAGLLLLHGERGQPVRTPLVANAIVKKSKYKKDEQELEVALEGGKRFASVGGTSAASPVVAGIIAQVNDRRLSAGKPTLGWLNPALYACGEGVFNDVTTGKTSGGIVGGFPAAKGWDAATGFGTVQYKPLAKCLVAN